VDSLTRWWDGVEEWLTSMSFVPQLLVCAAIVIPLAIGIAVLMNVLVDASFRLFDRRDSTDVDGGER
jgi:hypothetical protein